MLTIFGRKKITPERTAHIFTHNILETVEKGFPDIAGFINDSPEFLRCPNVNEEDLGHFLLVVIAGNFQYLPQYFQEGQDKAIIENCIQKFAPVFEMTPVQFGMKVKEYQDFMNRVNVPSKNILYGMSKAVAFKYGLIELQDDYFRQMKAPNPIFLKNLDDLVRNFLWDWEAFNERYKVIV